MAGGKFLSDEVMPAIDIKNEIQKLKNNDLYSMSSEDMKEAKNALNDIKQVYGLRVEGKKMAMINQVVDGIIKNIELASNSDIEVKTAMDLKFLAEANEKNYKLLENLMRIDSADGNGTAAMTRVVVKTVDTSGKETYVGVETR